MSRPSACSSSMGALHFGTWRQSMSIASDADVDAGATAVTKNLPVFRRLGVLVRATVDLAIVKQARRQRRRRLGSPAGVATVVSKRAARVLAAEGNSLVAGGRVGAIAEIWVLHTSGLTLGRAEGALTTVMSCASKNSSSSPAPRGEAGVGDVRGGGLGMAVGLAVPGDDRPLISSSMRRSGLVEKDAPSSCRHETNKGSSSPKFCAEHGPRFSPAALGMHGLPGHWSTHRPTVSSSRPASPLDGGGSRGHWTVDTGTMRTAGRPMGREPGQPTQQLAGLGALPSMSSVPVGRRGENILF